MKKKFGSGFGKFTAKTLGRDFLEAAKYFRKVQESNSGKFSAAAKLAGIDRRTAYYLVQIDRKFRELGVEEARLKALGWTKVTDCCRLHKTGKLRTTSRHGRNMHGAGTNDDSAEAAASQINEGCLIVFGSGTVRRFL
jgi:hypothetical protein